MKYTEQEIEMLARFLFACDFGCDALWNAALLSTREYNIEVRQQLQICHDSMVKLKAAARLMREAREQGAADMRERCAAELDAKSYPPEYAGNAIRALPLTVPQ